MNEVEIVVKTNDKTDFNAITAKARSGMTKSIKSSLDDVEKTTNARFKEIGDHSGQELGDALDEHLRRWSDHATETVDVKVKTKFKEVGEHSGNELKSGLERSFKGGGGIGGDLGGTISENFSKSFASGLREVGAYGMAVLAAVLVAEAPAIGAVAALGIVGAFGAGLAGLGLMAAFHLKSVQREFKSFQKFLGSFMKDIGKPFEGVWDQIFKTGTSVLKAFQPVLKSAFQGMAPAIERFVKSLGDAFKELTPAIKPVADAFSSLLDAIGPSLPGIFHGIAQAITEMADVIAANPKLFAGFITGLVGLIPIGLKAVAFLAKLFDGFAKFLHTKNPFAVMAASLSPVLAILMHLGKAGEVFHTLGDAAKSVGKHLSGVFDKIKAVAKPRLKEIGDQIKNELVPAFDRFVKAITPIADKLVDLFGPSVVENVRTFLDLVSGVIDIVSGLLDAISGLASGDWGQVWDGLKEGARGAVKVVKAAIRSILDSLTLGHGGKVLSIAIRAKDEASKVVKSAGRALESVAKKTYRATLSAANKVGGAVKSAASACTGFARRAYRAALTASNKVSGAVRSAASACTGFAKRAYRATLSARNAVASALRSAIGMGNSWARRVFTATFNVVKHIIPGMAHGGIVGHAAEGGPRSNTVMVGEHGPELVNLPAGSRVRSNSDTRAALANGANGGGQPILVQLMLDGKVLAQQLITPLRNEVRTRGGRANNSVQRVLGGTI